MDKNKDFIRIDDVFKSMADAEEATRTGAWADMRALLDKELPLETAVTGSKTKALRYVLPALLVLLLGGGLYVWNNHQRSGTGAGSAFKPAGTTSATGLPERPDHPVTPGRNKPFADTAGHLVVNVPAVNPQPSAGKRSSHHALAVKSRNVAALSAVNNPTTLSGRTSDHNEPARRRHSNDLARAVSQDQDQTSKNTDLPVGETTASPVVSRQPVSKLAASGSSGKDIKATGPVSPALQPSLSEISHDHAFERIKPDHQQLPEEDQALAEHLAKEHHLEKVGQLAQQDVYQSSDNGGLYKEQKDTFKRIELVQKRSDKSYTQNLKRPFVPQLDTVAVYKIARLSFVPLTIAEAGQLPPASLVSGVRPAGFVASYSLAAAPVASREPSSVDLVPLKDFRVSSHKLNGSIFSRWFQYANGGVSGLFDGSKDWYISLLFGGNMGLGSPNAYGMQAGASFLYALAERWTLALEMRYQNSNYANFRFYDNAITYQVSGEKVPLGTQFTGTEFKTQTNYQANSLSRISVPVLLSYNLGRVSVFAGPEFSYYFHLNSTHSETVQTTAVSKLAYDNKNPFTDEYYRLDPATDFKARFALGYAFGLSYDFSRKISLDLRFNQMLWDNSGKYQLDAVRKIYRQPAVELNLGFYLGRKDKVIYIMDRNR
ncbi:MAG TPA: porin family protein [Edaphocola sp.]|nr:porin family protein [Edaphocola sp.]